MLTAHQLRWGVEQWTAYLKDVDIPIMPRSRFLLQALLETAGENISPKELAEIVTGDPFLALRLLRTAEKRRSRTLGHDTTTPLASILQIGTEDLVHIIQHCELCDDTARGLAEAEFRAATASFLARCWAGSRADLSPDEIALAALLADIGETMLWQFAPELPLKVAQGMDHFLGRPASHVEMETIGFSFRSLTLHLGAAWDLPPLLTALIRGVNTTRANIARIASQVARHLQDNPENPQIGDDMRALQEILPHVGVNVLLAPLPVAEEFRASLIGEMEATGQGLSAAA